MALVCARLEREKENTNNNNKTRTCKNNTQTICFTCVLIVLATLYNLPLLLLCSATSRVSCGVVVLVVCFFSSRALVCVFASSTQCHSGSVQKVAWAHPEFGQVLASCSTDRSVVIYEEQGRIACLCFFF